MNYRIYCELQANCSWVKQTSIIQSYSYQSRLYPRVNCLPLQGIAKAEFRLLHRRRRRHMLPPLADVAACAAWATLAGAMQMLPASCTAQPARLLCLTVWLFGLPVASILNCYALDNLNTRRRKNKTRTAKGEVEGKAANAIADRLLDQCGRLGSCN